MVQQNDRNQEREELLRHKTEQAKNRFSETSEKVADYAAQQSKDMKDSAKNLSSESGESVKEKGYYLADQAMEQAGEAVNAAKRQGEDFFNRQRDWLAEEISHYSEAMKSASNKLHEQNDHNLAECTDSIAQQVNQLANYVRTKDLNSLWSDVERTARRRPEIFFGGLFLAGLAVARFFKASQSRYERERYGTEHYYPEYEDYEEYEEYDPEYFGKHSNKPTYGKTGGYGGSYSGGTPYSAGTPYYTGESTSMSSPDVTKPGPSATDVTGTGMGTPTSSASNLESQGSSTSSKADMNKTNPTKINP